MKHYKIILLTIIMTMVVLTMKTALGDVALYDFNATQEYLYAGTLSLGTLTNPPPNDYQPATEVNQTGSSSYDVNDGFVVSASYDYFDEAYHRFESRIVESTSSVTGLYSVVDVSISDAPGTTVSAYWWNFTGGAWTECWLDTIWTSTFMTCNITSLSDGLNSSGYSNFLVFVPGYNGLGNLNIDYVNFTVEYSPNSAPSAVVPSINSSDGTNYTNQSLNCFFTPLDADLDPMTANVSWYKNDVLNLSLNFTGLSNGTLFSTYMGSGNTTKGEVWNCTSIVCDNSSNCNSWSAAQGLTVLNDPIKHDGTISINKSSPPVDQDIECDNSSITVIDADLDDTTWYWDWLNGSVSQGINNKVLGAGNTTVNDLWQCVAWISDGDTNSSNMTSSSVSIGTSNVAPTINWSNATTVGTGLASDSNNPTNNNTLVNLSVQYDDANTIDNHSAFFCKNNAATASGCVGEAWCIADSLVPNTNIDCVVNVSNLSTRIHTYYVFVSDNTSLVSTSTSGSFELNFVPSAATLVFPTDGSYIGSTFTSLNWSATDPDGDSINYTLYVNSSDGFAWNYTGNNPYYNFTDAITEYRTYFWRVFTFDQHGYGLYNTTLGNFTTDFTMPEMNVTNPEDGATYTDSTVLLTLQTYDPNLDVCNYSIYYDDTSTLKTSSTASCNSSVTVQTPYYSGGYRIEVYAYDLAGNYNQSSINFTTQAPPPVSGGGGGGPTYIETPVTTEQKQQPALACGNNVCDETEDPFNCPQDCQLFSLDEMFCTPWPNCGNWQRSWFINTVIVLVTAGLFYQRYKSRKVKRPI